MKKCVSIILSLCLATLPVFSDIEAEYNRKRLSIHYFSDVSGSWTEVEGSFGSYPDWRFHQGSTEIEESEFLLIAGYAREAHEAARRENNKKRLRRDFIVVMGGSIVPLVFGGGFIAAGIAEERGSFESEWFKTGGYFFLALFGVAAAVGGVIGLIWRSRDKHWMPLEQAYSIAENYNRKLMESLKTAE